MTRIHVSHPRRYYSYCVNVMIAYIHKSDSRLRDDPGQTVGRSIIQGMRVASAGNTSAYTNSRLREQNKAWIKWLNDESIPHHFEGTHHYEIIPRENEHSLSPEWENRLSIVNTLVHLYDRNHAFETRLRFDVLRVERGMRPIEIHKAFEKKWDTR